MSLHIKTIFIVVAALICKVWELERFNKLAIGRENRIIELKRQVNELCEKHSEPERCDLSFAE